MIEPIICFGQQPNGFFPKRFFYAKVESAKRLQKEIGGKIIFFYHDSDADYRETSTALIDKQTGKEVHLNFEFQNKLQKKHSPLYAKKILSGWQEKTIKLLPQYVSKVSVEIFKSVSGNTAADFCLNTYEKLGLLEGITVIRSGDPEFRKRTLKPTDYFVDAVYQNELVRARMNKGQLTLHEGGNKFIILPAQDYKNEAISAARDSRFAWMQSVIKCTHYIYGEGEKAYLDKTQFPEVKFIDRDKIENASLAYTI